MVLVGVDAVLWAACLTELTALRFDMHFSRVDVARLVFVIAVAVTLQAALGHLTPLYRARWRIGSLEEVVVLAPTMLTVGAVITFVSVVPPVHMLPLSTVVASGAVTLLFAAGLRVWWRLNQERRLVPDTRAERTIIFGAGEAASQLVDGLLRNPDCGYTPVALLDDDPHKRNQRLRRLRVTGNRDDIAATAATYGAQSVIIAIPSAGSEVVREITGLAEAAGLEAKILPTVAQMLSFEVRPDDIRPVTPADLLGRRVISTEIEQIAGYLTGRRVLVTGAGGSIGSELCRQIHRYGPSSLIMLDRDESALHQVQLSIEGRALLDERTLVLCDIRDARALNEVFDEHRPEVVFHAAALKHLPMLEMWPEEAVKTNVMGTFNVLSTAERFGVDRFVNVSTDKAANPTSVLGYSKRLAERLTAEVARRATGTYLSVRFGNVLGSRGSVLTTFQAQIASGGPLTVTHPEVTRYFMMVEEAVELVIQAGAVGRDGQVLVLDMGQPVRIAEVAERMAADSPRPIEIVYTGLREGEKLDEELFGDGEVGERSVHPMITHVDVPPLAAIELGDLRRGASVEAFKVRLEELCRRGVAAGEGAEVELIDLSDGPRDSLVR